MRWLFGVLAVVVTAGCAEVAQGPRFVYISETNDRFYIRHAPTTPVAEVDAIAASACQRIGQKAQLQQTAQYYWFDVRDATYDCTRS
jgi:hypothetical protein